MLIDLADELGEQAASLCKEPASVHALRCLAIAHQEGKHFITGNHAVLAAFGRAEALGRPSQVAFLNARRSLNEGHALRKEVQVFARVVRDAPAGERIDEAGGRLCFRVPLGEFADSGRVQQTRLVCEHLDDARVYRAAAEALLKRSKFSALKLAVSPVHGGGQTTGPVFEARAVDGAVVCVVDSDRADESAVIGSTARQVQEVRARLHRGSGFLLADAYVLEMCRELENLLPTALVLDALAGVPDLLRCAVKAAEHGQLGQGDFIDIKKVLARHAGREGQVEVLAHVAAFVAKTSAEKVAQYLFQAPLGEVWSGLAERLFAWGCAPRRTFVV